MNKRKRYRRLIISAILFIALVLSCVYLYISFIPKQISISLSNGNSSRAVVEDIFLRVEIQKDISRNLLIPEYTDVIEWGYEFSISDYCYNR